MTIHICSGNDPNDGKGVGNYQAEKNDIGLEVVFFSSKNDQGVLILNYYPWINSGILFFLFQMGSLQNPALNPKSKPK